LAEARLKLENELRIIPNPPNSVVIISEVGAYPIGRVLQVYKQIELQGSSFQPRIPLASQNHPSAPTESRVGLMPAWFAVSMSFTIACTPIREKTEHLGAYIDVRSTKLLAFIVM